VCTKEAGILSQITGYEPVECLPFANYANILRKLKGKELPQAPGIREVKRWIEFTPIYGAEFAFEITIANKCVHGEPDKIANMMEAYKMSEEFRKITGLHLESHTPVAKASATTSKAPVKAKPKKMSL
jgi:hypothetical protein